MRALSQRLPLTVVLCTHSVVAASTTDRVVMLVNNVVAEQGPYEQLIAQRGPFWHMARSHLGGDSGGESGGGGDGGAPADADGLDRDNELAPAPPDEPGGQQGQQEPQESDNLAGSGHLSIVLRAHQELQGDEGGEQPASSQPRLSDGRGDSGADGGDGAV